MDLPQPKLLILVDPPDAFSQLFGISLLERLLRVLQRLGFDAAVICSDSVELVARHLCPRSWASSQVSVSFHEKTPGPLTVDQVIQAAGTEGDLVLFVSAGFYCDARLLRAMAGERATALLIDSALPPDCARLWRGERPNQENIFGAAATLETAWLSQRNGSAIMMDALWSDASSGCITIFDAAQQPTYVSDLRKHIRPVFFPAPAPDLVPTAQRFVRETAQNGVLDLPGWLDSPIEDWIVSRICRTAITPNQVTFATALIGVGATLLFATGHLWFGVVMAYFVEVMDGVDGKLARTKVETTRAGKWEHLIDYFIELSWWTALAWHFRDEMHHAFAFLILLFGSDLLDQRARGFVKKKTGRSMDDVARFDRFVRWIGARRNINIWILAVGLLLKVPGEAFVFFCGWTAVTTAIHIIRAVQIGFSGARLKEEIP
jgi:1L-myo-inositol 1-phosphate cytidylyltransferase / CDP-L-myo-inositol myo-inositolphosphotransferase